MPPRASMAVLYPAISLMLWGTQLLNSLSSQMAPSSVSVKILLSSLIVWSKVYPSTSRKLVHRHEDGSVALSRRVVERDKLPYEIIVVLIRRLSDKRRTLVNMTSLALSCLNNVSNLVKHASSSKALKLNCEVALSNVHMPKLLPLWAEVSSRMEMQ